MNSLDAAEAYLTDSGLIDRSGAVLYSADVTLVAGPVYLLGLNPGGAAGATLAESIAGSRAAKNAYLDEEWVPGGRRYRKGEAPLQRRIQALCKAMGRDTRDVPASNLAFTRSTGISSHPGFQGAIDLCEPVHRIFIAAINPRFVMTFGNLKHFSRGVEILTMESIDARHGKWQAHRGAAIAFGHRVAFGNVPHLSFWASEYRGDVVDWVVEAARPA
ncbi:hypothetical protein M0208_17015 [Sphingomonas sp. SUN019]|uniref:hypothetical protein n=1 Tax=Sphingomonas sp. SUN019 TaxID=2937788 RepID=UPI0021647487|nr:hypothetical protein [Sphingomonas sp. SUN019]UVO52128.1 hypothetical protein M0208_17015 [Sphingomonas sp. SUN019]